MIITISGSPGSGKSTAASLLAEKLGYTYHSIGELMRSLAAKRGMSLLQISGLAETDASVDRELDEAQVTLGRSEKDFVLDSRLGYHFIPQSFKVFLKVSAKEAAERIFQAQREHEAENETLEQTEQNIVRRIASERKRYGQFYGIDPYDESQYDLVIDTTGSVKERTVEKILQAIGKQ